MYQKPAPDVTGILSYEPSWDCTISRKEVQSQPSAKWHTTKKHHESNTIQYGDQLLTTTELGYKSTNDRLRWRSGNPWGPCRRWHIIHTNDHCTKEEETKAMQLCLKFSLDKYVAIWYRSNNPNCTFKIAGENIP